MCTTGVPSRCAATRVHGHARGAALVHGRVQRVRRVQRGCSARLQSVCCDNTARVQNCARRTGRVGAHLRALELLVRVVIGHGLGLWCADEQRRAEGRLHGVDEQRWHLVRAQRMRSVHTQCGCRRSMHSACSVCSARGVTGRRRRRGLAAPRAGRAWPRRSSSRRRRRAAATREGAGGGAARAGGGARGQRAFPREAPASRVVAGQKLQPTHGCMHDSHLRGRECPP